MNEDLEENTGNYNNNGCVNRHFVKSMRRNIKQRTVLKPSPKCENEKLYDVTKRIRLRNIDIRSELGETNIVHEIIHYRKKWKEHIQSHL
jgi:hypothetical protein